MPLRRRLVCGSMPTTPRLCELTLRMLKVAAPALALGQDQPGLQGRAVGHRLVGGHRGVGRLAAEPSATSSRTIGMRVEPPTSSTRSRCGPVQSRRLQGLHAGEAGAIQEVLRRLLELLAGDLHPRSALPWYSADDGGLGRAESVRLASSHSRHSLPAAVGSSRGSQRMLAAGTARPPGSPAAGPSRSRPGRTSPSVARARNSLPRISITVTSNVPPPRS